MNELNLRGRLLTTLFRRGQANENIDLFGLAESCACSPAEVRASLAQLAQAGLVDARRARLTLAGLACATALARYQAAPAERGRRSSPLLSSACRAA
jgi:hypothetical protein